MRWNSKTRYWWHRWFAWYPVQCDDRNAGKINVWLEWVERKFDGNQGGEWTDYRLITDKTL